MPEIITLLLPTNIWTFLIWTLLILLLVFKSKKISSKWFSIELDKASNKNKGLEGELILKDRLLKEYKIFRLNTLSEISKLKISFRYHFSDSIVKYLDTIDIFKTDKPDECRKDCILRNRQMITKAYIMSLELSLITIVAPALINIIFRNGFPLLPTCDKIGTKQYDEDLVEFERVGIEKYNNVLMSMELRIDGELNDHLAIDPQIFKNFYHSKDTKAIDSTCREVVSFFKKMILEKNEIVKTVYKDYDKLFDDEKQCHKFIDLYFRNQYE